MKPSVTIDRMIDGAGAAAFLGVKKQTLSLWRCTGRYSLPFVKVGRAVRYRVSDLEAFVINRTVMNTGQADQLMGDR